MPVLEWMPIIAALSFTLLIAWLIISTIEQRRGTRLFAIGLRGFLDRICDRITRKLCLCYVSITRHKMKLSWYYSIHAVLVAVLAFLGVTYTKIENVVISNRDKAKKIRKEKQSLKKTHLTEIAEHKENVQLSSKEKTRRKNESLKGL
ncbi:MAG: hypothetical protein ACK42D_02270 [Candidatus Paceibacteria bacterium]